MPSTLVPVMAPGTPFSLHCRARGRTARVAAAALFAVTFLGACSRSGGDDDEGASDRAADSTSTTAPAPLAFTVTGIETNGTAEPPAEVVAAVTAVLDAYLAEAVVAPLRSGTPAGELTGVLSAAARERLAADPAVRGSLVDEGMPVATSVTAERADVVLGSVAGPDGVPALLAARIDLAVHATGEGLDIDIVRNGELVLSPEPEGWRIDSFVVHTERNTRDA